MKRSDVFKNLALIGLGFVPGGAASMEAIKNIKMVEAAREEAKRLLSEDITLSHYPAILSRLADREKPTHFE